MQDLFSKQDAGSTGEKSRAFQLYFFFPIHRYIHNFWWFFFPLSWSKKTQHLRGKAHKHSFYLYVNSPASHKGCDAVQGLARSLKPFPERLPYKAPMPPWLSASALPSLGHEDWFSFSQQVKVQSVCPLPTTLRVDNTTTRSTWKTRPGGAFPPPLSLSLG